MRREHLTQETRHYYGADLRLMAHSRPIRPGLGDAPVGNYWSALSGSQRCRYGTAHRVDSRTRWWLHPTATVFALLSALLKRVIIYDPKSTTLKGGMCHGNSPGD
jgi:hypothetical protein